MDTKQENASAVAILITWYLTPLAVLLVILGVVFGHPDTMNSGFSITIVALSALMNITSVVLMKQSPERALVYRNYRVWLNYGANFFLLYLLMPSWPEVWLLVLLMTVATGIYNSFKSTIIHCVIFSAFLFVIADLTGELTGIKIGQNLMHVIVIMLLGPFVHKLVRLYNAVPA